MWYVVEEGLVDELVLALLDDVEDVLWLSVVVNGDFIVLYQKKINFEINNNKNVNVMFRFYNVILLCN